MRIFERVNSKLFFIVWIGVILGLFAIIPYSLTMQSSILESIQLPYPLGIIVLFQVSFNSLIFGVLVYFGLLLAQTYHLGLPFIEGKINGETISESFAKIVLISTIIGILVGFSIILLDSFVFDLESHLSNLGITLPEMIVPEKWKGFLASFWGGISEEVLLRLFFLTLVIWLLMLITRNKSDSPSPIIIWIANIIAAFVFGIGHLPAMMSLGIEIDTYIFVRSIVLNGIGGITFGWLYFTYGLESAMIAHFCADIVIHVIF